MTNNIPNYDLPSDNHQIRLISRPSGTPVPSDFEIAKTPLKPLKEGTFRIRNLYLSVDPVQRGWCADENVMPIGKVMRGLAVGIVIESRANDFSQGDLVYGYMGWQTYHDAVPSDVMTHIKDPHVPASLYAGVLGMPGITAYLALMDLAPPKAGDLLLVSTAAGAVGSVVGQLAAQAGATAVGLTGDDEKVAKCIEHYGYEKAYNYKTNNIDTILNEAAPDGFTIYYDNVGGPILDAAIRNMALYGRIVQCGTAATSSWKPAPSGMRNEREILMRRLSWNGFVIFDHLERFTATAKTLEQMVLASTLQHEEDITDGLENATSAFERVFSGQNQGKTLICIT